MKKSVYALLISLTVSTMLTLIACNNTTNINLTAKIPSKDGAHVHGGPSQIFVIVNNIIDKNIIDKNKELTALAKENTKKLFKEMYDKRYIGSRHFHIGDTFDIANNISDIKEKTTRKIRVTINIKSTEIILKNQKY